MAKAAEHQKSIFITGAGSGIGRASAHLFAARGWFVGLADVNDAGAAETARDMPPNSCVTVKLDVRDREAWRAAVTAFAQATGGRMHALVNNAGIARGGPFESVTPEEADQVIAVNVTGVMNGVYACLDLLKVTPGARIINMSSVAGVYGAPNMAVYSASKFAVRGLSEALDIELEKYGVAVKCVMPWFVETPILDLTPRNANANVRETLTQGGVPIYPVEMAAEAVWRAAHESKTHFLVGKAAERVSFAARLSPSFVKSRLRKLPG